MIQVISAFTPDCQKYYAKSIVFYNYTKKISTLFSQLLTILLCAHHLLTTTRLYDILLLTTTQQDDRYSTNLSNSTPAGQIGYTSVFHLSISTGLIHFSNTSSSTSFIEIYFASFFDCYHTGISIILHFSHGDREKKQEGKQVLGGHS